MILHQQILHPANGPRLPWLAVHVDTLTLCLCTPAESLINIAPISQPLIAANPITSFNSGTAAHIRLATAADLVAKDIYFQNPETFVQVISPLITDHSALGTQNYLLLNSLDGKTPAVMHTADPAAIYLADIRTGILAPTEHFRSSVDLTVEGWAYWWEDAQRAFHKLTVGFCIDSGIPVPEAIADAVRHH